MNILKFWYLTFFISYKKFVLKLYNLFYISKERDSVLAFPLVFLILILPLCKSAIGLIQAKWPYSEAFGRVSLKFELTLPSKIGKFLN